MLAPIRIRKAFSKAAFSYEGNAYLQKRIGQEFLQNLERKKIDVKKILDIGMGTGWLSTEISRLFGVYVMAIDSAFGMAYCAKDKKGLKVLQAEAENLPFKDKSFELIVSNLTYQWVKDLDKALLEIKRLLQPQGTFCFTCFAKETLKELRLCFDYVLKGLNLKPIYELPDKEKIISSLKRNGFKTIEFINRKDKEMFNDLFSLLRWLKSVGANVIGRPRFISRDSFSKLDEFYQANFKDNGKVYATFELIEVMAIKATDDHG